MIEVKGNILIIKVAKKEDTVIFNEIIDFVNSKVKNSNMDKIFKLAEELHQIDTDFKFDRGEIYNEESRFHR